MSTADYYIKKNNTNNFGQNNNKKEGCGLKKIITNGEFLPKQTNSTPKTRFSEPRFSERLDLMNKLQLPFSYFTLYPDSI